MLIALRTTRRDDVAEALRHAREEKQKSNKKAWRDHERSRVQARRKPRTEPDFPLPILDEQSKATVEGRVRPYSFIDYAYRLRIKTNYSDSSMFTDGPSVEGEAAAVHADLIRLASSSLLVHELYVRQLIGTEMSESS